MHSFQATRKFLVNTPYDICRAYAEGRIGWREAASMLKIECYDEFNQQLQRQGFRQPLPDKTESRQRMNALETLLYHEDEI